MKILFLSHTGLVSGGAEQCLLEYVNVLIERGYKCKVIVPYKGPMTRVLTERGIPHVVVGYGWATRPHRKVHPHRIMMSTGNSLVRLFQEVEKFTPDIIVTNTAVIPWGLYAGRAFNIPNILLAHEILSDKDPSLKVVPSYSEYGEILSQNSDYIIYNSQFVKREFASVLRVPNNVQGVLYPLPPLDNVKINKFFKENTIGNNLKIAIFGALSPRKNQLEALQALKILDNRGVEDFTLDLYGDTMADPSYTKTLQRYIKDSSLSNRVKIRGFTTSVYEKMNECNVVISTARYEPFGRTLIEGQLFGRIVISNDTGGGLELVDNMGTGLIYRFGDPTQLAEKIDWIINNQREALALGTNAKSEQLRKYVTDNRYDALLDAIDHFTKQKNVRKSDNVFDPVMDLFQYNNYLNNKYRHLYRLTHNRVTYPVKNLAARVLSKTKRIIKWLISK